MPISTFGCLLFHGASLIFLLSPLIPCITSTRLFTDIKIARALLPLKGMVKSSIASYERYCGCALFPHTDRSRWVFFLEWVVVEQHTWFEWWLLDCVFEEVFLKLGVCWASLCADCLRLVYTRSYCHGFLWFRIEITVIWSGSC